jgi:hypothetical protein
LRLWIASRSLSSGAHSRDPLARNGTGDRINPFEAYPRTGTAACPVITWGTKSTHLWKNFFIISVDRIFTTLLQRLFTNAFDVTTQTAAFACMYRACNAD